MKNSYILKKKASDVTRAVSKMLLKSFNRFYNIFLAKRTILFVTNQKIRTVNIGPIAQISMMVALVWMVNFCYQSIQYHKIIESKSREISKLKSLNEYFEDEFVAVNEKLQKINEYLIFVTGENQSVKDRQRVFKQPPADIKEEDLSKRDKNTLNQVRDADNYLKNVQLLAEERIKKIEAAVAFTGLNMRKPVIKKDDIQEVSLNDKNEVMPAGGPMVKDNSASYKKASSSKGNLAQRLEKRKFSNEIDHLIVLEKLAEVMPFSRPMKTYYISSGFGKRVDPITHGGGIHQGLDFVGPAREKIISPSEGKVILAGPFSNYGNAIVIDHGFGITSRYGHLSEIKVAVGKKVKKGDLIAIQGSTGRSTGAHLHYEVRYKDIPLNPKKFLEAGEMLFKGEGKTNYVNS